MEKLVFRRSGDRPLEFDGEVLAEVSTHSATRNEPAGRWYEARIARTAGGQYAAEVSYRTQWDNEDDVDDAYYGDEVEVMCWLQAYSPTAPVLGYPPGKQFDERRDRLMEVCHARWRTALTELLAELPPERIE